MRPWTHQVLSSKAIPLNTLLRTLPNFVLVPKKVTSSYLNHSTRCKEQRNLTQRSPWSNKKTKKNPKLPWNSNLKVKLSKFFLERFRILAQLNNHWNKISRIILSLVSCMLNSDWPRNLIFFFDPSIKKINLMPFIKIYSWFLLQIFLFKSHSTVFHS